jgi:peptidoglycan/xylan/chitin deacetylase (PgdA/CDA1 family)
VAGLFVISLDFELAWGVRGDVAPGYRANLLGVRQAVLALLDLFARHGIHATWATVGMLFFDRKDDLLRAFPSLLRDDPRGARAPHAHLDAMGADERSDPLHLARSLVLRIRDTPHQEIATHTFSHYECLAPGDHAHLFAADLDAALAAAAGLDIPIHSIVFPQNQYAAAHLDLCARRGLRVFRGAAPGRLYQPRSRRDDRAWHRLGRLVDAYLPVVRLPGQPDERPSGPSRDASGLINVPASRFLRPHEPRLSGLAPLKLRRITGALTAAAERGGLYHLWWHPHNFGVHLAENMTLLESVLACYAALRDRHGMRSATMAEAAAELA